MRLLSWLLCVAAATGPAFTSEERSVSRPKRDSSEKKIVCYYTNWSVYRPGTAKFSPQNINPYLCTHLIYAFGGLSKDNALKPFDKYQDIEQGGYAKFNGLKTYNKNLKTMVAIGGWNEGSARFSPLVADPERRKELVRNTIKFLRQNHFDGLDLDWEYPSFRDGGKPRDRDNYATLVQEFREEFERESEKTGRPRLLLTMAVPAGIEYIDKGYDVPKLNKYLDWMNILSYDYHSAFEPAINHHSPLFSLEEDDEYNFDAVLNIDHTVQHYLKLGAEKSKLVLGIPTYGRSYTLFNPDATDIGSPADGPGEQGEATREKGYLAYYEICERVKTGGWTLKNPNPEAMGPYAYKDNQWVGFDDEEIVRTKAKYVNDNDLGGIMFWSIDNDDFRGKCHGKPYPLIEAAKEALLATANELIPSTRTGSSRSNSKKQEETSAKPKTRKSRLRTKSSTTTEPSNTKSFARTSTTPQPPTTPDPGSDFVCKDEGFFPHPRDCKKYFWCLDSGPSSLGIVAHQFTCPSGLVFNKISDSCDYARNVICKTKSDSSTTTTTTTTSTTTTTTTSRATTARSRLVITASPPRTTSTTTEPPEEEEEEEEAEEDEEDPGTIKELINLIKKLGGVEELEKQLNLQNSEGKEKIKPSLYSRVLQGRTANRYRGVTGETTTTKYVSVFRNRPIGPQSPSTEETSTASRGSDKPRYVTIQRNRTTKKPGKAEEEEEEEEVEEEEEEVKQAAPKEETRPFRRRPNGDATTEREYVLLRRSRPQKEEDASTPKYKNIVRVRSTTEAAVEEEEDEQAEEEEIIEEEKPEEIETGQKLKKYSSIIRDNKRVVAEEESKVSGPQGPQNESGVSASTTDSASDGRDYVNNVNTVTSPRYVEIRRTQPTSTEPSESNVNTVNNFNDANQEHETNEVYANRPESGENTVTGFQRRITTEIVSRPTRPSLKSSTLARTTPITTETLNKVSRFRERPTTEDTPTVPTKPITQYKTLSRNTSQENHLPNQEKTVRATTAQTALGDVPRRFQFAPRTKPAILSPKPVETTTEVFQITVPDLPDPATFTEKNPASSQFPSATLEPTTATSPSADATISNTLQDVFTTFGEKKSPFSTSKFIPTTSTQTSVVTSITESSFTERKRIFVPKKARGNSDSKFVVEPDTTEEPFEISKPNFRGSLRKNNFRSTLSEPETSTEGRKWRFKSKTTTTTTTEEPAPVKKYVPKKTRIFKQISSTEIPEVTPNAVERVRFQPRNKPRHVEPGNSLQGRFLAGRRKKIFSKKEEDDLEVQQTATFFDDDFESNDRYIIGGALKQSSDRDYLNADVFFRTVPTVEEEERSTNKPEEELTNSLNGTEKKEPIKTKFGTLKPALRNLRTRTRPPSESSSVTEPLPFRSSSSTPRSSLFSSNYKTLRGRTDGGVRTAEGSVSSSAGERGVTESVQTLRLRKPRPIIRNKFPEAEENAEKGSGKDLEEDLEEAGFGVKSTGVSGKKVYTPGTGVYRISKDKIRQGKVISSVYSDPNTIQELQTDEPLRKATESSSDVQSLRNGRFRYRQQTKENSSEKPTESSATLTKVAPAFSAGSTRITTIESSISEKVSAYPSPTAAYIKSLSSVRGESEQVTEEGDYGTSSTIGSTFGTKTGVSLPSTVGSTFTENPKSRTAGTIRGTYITVASLVETSRTKDNGRTAKGKESDTTTEAIAVTSLLSNSRAAAAAAELSSNSKTRTRTRVNAVASLGISEKGQSSGEKSSTSLNSNRVLRTRGKVKAIDSIFQATESGSVNETVVEGIKGRSVFVKNGRKVLVRSRPVQSAAEVREEENELEPSEDLPSSTSKTTTSERTGNQEYFTNLRTRGKSTTQTSVTGDRTERKRTQLDRRRFRGESRSTTLKPEVRTEVSLSTSRPNIILQRRKLRPSTTPSTTTTTTTEEQYTEQQEDSRLEESKALDESPGIQDLADPAVVAIHNLATVSPGPLASAAVTSPLNQYSRTPASYTVHVTPADIASFSTPANPVSVTPGSLSSRPTSILTLKPYTIPLITRQYVTKQPPSPFKPASTLRETTVPVATKEPFNLRGEILSQSRKQEVPQRVKPAPFIASPPQKEAAPKPRRLKPFSKVPKQEVVQSASSSEPPVDYEYYDDNEDPLANIPASALKVKVHSDGYIECLDRGNFPHPFSCKKFISCAKMENNELLGWEYTCPKHLSFDPVGGICNWSAGLGCQH